MLHQIKAPQFYTNFLKLISLVMGSSTSEVEFKHGCILEGIVFLSILSILLPTHKSGICRDKYLSVAIFKEAVHSDDP